MTRVLILHGPNLNALGSREPEVYGRTRLDEVDADLRRLAAELEMEIEILQSQHEGVLIDAVHRASGRFDGIVLNPGGLTHTSVALADAVRSVPVPTVEVHVSNPHARESFRRRSYLSPAALGVVQGFGPGSYGLALRALAGHLRHGR